MGFLGDKRAVAYLIQALKDSNPLVQRTAAEALGRITGEKY
ncbi:MAG: HEAT repeat domain-containing protein [Planctomycetota bacterium]